MYFGKDDIRKVVTYYSIFTCIYFSLLILILYWTNGIYSLGKYSFNSVITLLLIAEIVKYFSSTLYFKSHDVNLSKKYDDKIVDSVMKQIFSKATIKEGFRNFFVASAMILVYSAISILYGAEVFAKYEETFMFSSLLSVLTVLPACLNLGPQSVIGLILGSKPGNNLESLIYQNFYLTLIGAWLGAFVIPLDWDRPWQVWPIPCSFGAIMGYELSHFVMLFKVKSNIRKKTKRAI